MSEGRGLARYATQPEAGLGVEVGGLQPAVVEAEAFRRGVLKKQLAIVEPAERVGGEAKSGVGIEAAGPVQEASGIGGHGFDIGGSAARATPLASRLWRVMVTS